MIFQAWFDGQADRRSGRTPAGLATKGGAIFVLQHNCQIIVGITQENIALQNP
jgi:hypothetical protein